MASMFSRTWNFPVGGKATKRAFALNLLRSFYLCSMVTLAGVASLPPAGAQTLTGRIQTSGSTSQVVAVNPLTNRLYVTNFNSRNVTVIDGATSSVVAMVATGQNPADVAVNTATDTIYVANADGTVTAIDGPSNRTQTVTAGSSPFAIAVNPVTNKIYVANNGSNNVTVIDGATNNTAQVGAGTNPVAVAVDVAANKIYVANRNSNNVTVIDGTTNGATTVSTVANPSFLAVNPVTHRIYVSTNVNPNNVTVIDGPTNTTSTLSFSGFPTRVAVNPVTNRVYITNVNGTGNSIGVFDGATNALLATVSAGTNPFDITVNPLTNQIYVGFTSTNSVVAIDGATNNSATVPGTLSGALRIGVNQVTDRIYVTDGGSGVAVIDGATNGTASIGVGVAPAGVGVNLVTGRIYVANTNSNNVTIADPATGGTATVAAGSAPNAVAVNSVTNKAYVSNFNSNNVTVIDGANNATMVQVGASPVALAVNPLTNRTYVANSGGGVTVIDGANGTSTIPAGTTPFSVDVNQITNQIYVANRDSNNVTVIDGPSGSAVATIPAGNSPQGIAVDPLTNQIYVSNNGDNTVMVIDGATNTVSATIPVGTGPRNLAVNPLTDKIYVPNLGNFSGSTLTVIDGATHATATVTTGSSPFGVVVNTTTNKVYVTNLFSASVTEIDGVSNTATNIPVGPDPEELTVNPVTNQVFVSNHNFAGTSSSTVSVINEQQTQAIPLTTAIAPIAQSSNTTPTFTFSATDGFSPNPTTIDRVHFQLDTWQGPWLIANPGGANATGTPASPLSVGTHVLYAFATDSQDATTAGLSKSEALLGSIAAQVFTVTPPAAPAVSLNPPSLTFTSPAIGTVSAAQTITLTNDGSATLTIGSIALTGTNSGDFSLTSNTCTTGGTGGTGSVAAGASCTISLTFKPTAGGTRTASVTITDNAGNSPQSVSLTGSIPAPVATFSPTSLNFASQAIGTTSAAQTITFTNSGSSTLSIGTIAVAGTTASSFSETNTCGTTLAAGASCTISVTFNPMQSGALSATLVVSDNTGDSPQSLGLSGTATGTGPAVVLSPAALTLGSQPVGTASAAQSFTLQNTSSAAISISSVAIGGANAGDFSVVGNACGTSVAAGAACAITVRFTPTAAGTRTASAVITDNAGNSPQSESLTGTGTGPGATFSPASITFTSQSVGTTSAAQTVTLTNSGNADLSITSISANGLNGADFAQTNNCGTSLVAGANCTIGVTFVPLATGTRTASLLVTDNAGNSPQSVSLTGTGTPAVPAPAVTLSPGSLTFGSQTLGTTSAAQSVTLQNTGNAALSISSIALAGINPGDFSATNTCGTSVAAGAACAITVRFTPTAAGTRTASAVITDNAGNSPQSVSLTGTAVATAPTVALSPTSLTFASQTVGTTSATQTVTVSNTGNAALSVTSIAVAGTNSGDFSQSNTCGTSVAAGANCTITVAFKPTATGARTASITIANNASNSPQSVSLTGTGTGTGPGVQLTPASLTFGNQAVGTSVTQSIDLLNSGNAALTISSIAITGTNSADFAQSNTCGTGVAAGANCTISVTFKPTATGARTASITIADNAGNSPQTVSLTGTGEDVTVAAASGSATSATITAGQSATYSLQITATGAAQTVSLTCTGAPQGATCTVPATVNVTPGTPATVNVSVSTTARAMFLPGPSSSHWGNPGTAGPIAWVLAMLALLFWMPTRKLAQARGPRPVWVTRLGFATPLLLLVLSVAVMSGCAGGSSKPPAIVGTPAGTATITVTAVANGVSHSAQFTLTVQ
jgi:YVTN family beta-propeller protein